MEDLTGRRFGRLTVLGRAYDRPNDRNPRWDCICDCGNRTSVYGTGLRNGSTKSCGCYSREIRKAVCKGEDLTGRKFGRLTVLSRSDFTGHGKTPKVYYNCLCDCGNTTVSRSDQLKNGEAKSCGCYWREKASAYMKEHPPQPRYGDSRERIHNIWYLMKYRCEDPTSPAYNNYGGRGIKVCEEWGNGDAGYFAFKQWAMDNGYSENLTIDRIDNDGDYSPENCRWVDVYEQANNKRNNHYIEYNGETHTLKQWSDIVGIPYKTLHNRVKSLGWDFQRAITQPVRVHPAQLR